MTICFILRLIFFAQGTGESYELWVYCITAMCANCITALTKWVFYFPFSYLQQFNKVILGLGWDDVRKTKRGGQRGYEGLSIKRAPRRQPGFEFGGRQMLESIANFMRINPPPLPLIEVIMIFGIIKSPLHTNPDMFNWNHDNCFTQTWSGLKLKLEKG